MFYKVKRVSKNDNGINYAIAVPRYDADEAKRITYSYVRTRFGMVFLKSGCELPNAVANYVEGGNY